MPSECMTSLSFPDWPARVKSLTSNSRILAAIGPLGCAQVGSESATPDPNLVKQKDHIRSIFWQSIRRVSGTRYWSRSQSCRRRLVPVCSPDLSILRRKDRQLAARDMSQLYTKNNLCIFSRRCHARLIPSRFRSSSSCRRVRSPHGIHTRRWLVSIK